MNLLVGALISAAVLATRDACLHETYTKRAMADVLRSHLMNALCNPPRGGSQMATTSTVCMFRWIIFFACFLFIVRLFLLPFYMMFSTAKTGSKITFFFCQKWVFFLMLGNHCNGVNDGKFGFKNKNAVIEKRWPNRLLFLAVFF